MHGVKNQIQFEANTVGSVYQLGVDKIFEDLKDPNFKSAFRYKFKLPNGWTISGEMDQVDFENRIIYDNKVTNTTSIDKIRSEKRNHSYALQLGVYRLLMKKYGESIGEDYSDFTGVLATVDKKYSYFGKAKYNQLTFIEPEMYDTDEIELMLIEKTDQLQDYIDHGVEPGKCANVFPYKPRGASYAKPMRCLHYCDVAAHCSYFTKKTNPNTKINSLMEL